MKVTIKTLEDGTRVKVISGTGLEKRPRPYRTNKPGVPPGAVPEEVKAQMRRRKKR